jgi:hypothetical protein
VHEGGVHTAARAGINRGIQDSGVRPRRGGNKEALPKAGQMRHLDWQKSWAAKDSQYRYAERKLARTRLSRSREVHDNRYSACALLS